MTRARRALMLVAGLVVAAILLSLSLAKLDLRLVLAEAARVSLPWLGVSVLVRLFALTLAAIRSRILFAPLADIGVYRLFKSLVLGFVVQNVIPLRAGEFARVGYLARFSGLPASTCLAVVATERLLDLFALLTLFLAVLPVAAVDLPIGSALYLSGIASTLAVGAAVVLSKHPQRFVAVCAFVGGLMGRTIGSFVETRSASFARGFSALGSVRSILGVLLLSGLFWVGSAGTIKVWMIAFGLQQPWYAPVVVLAFLSLGLAVPTTPGNIGTYHFLVFSAVALMGVDETRAGAFALVSHAMSIVPLTLIGLALLSGDFYRPARAQSSS